jgi:uncharacterized protein YabN with tetrapyrrole methylase and pyrophosphatase domain
VSRGSLTIVGTGIKFAVQTPPEARAAIETSDEVLFLCSEPAGDNWLTTLNAHARSLAPIYEAGVDRGETRSLIYEAMADQIMQQVHAGHDVCVALYGHPMVLATPARLAAERAGSEGYRVRVLPGISAVDCLLADLQFDPGRSGMQSYEAARFLQRQPAIEPSAALILWQVGAVGTDHAVTGPPGAEMLAALTDRLLQTYPPGHEITIYRASEYAAFEPHIGRVSLRDLPTADIDPMATLFIPPLG